LLVRFASLLTSNASLLVRFAPLLTSNASLLVRIAPLLTRKIRLRTAGIAAATAGAGIP
jgi:hypothetical protein